MVMTAYTLAQFLTDIGSVFTSAIGWVGSVGSTITSDPVLLCFTALPLCGLGIGFFKRLLRVD